MVKREFTASEILAIAAAAHADPRTVRKLLDGEEVRGMVRDRIAAAVVGLVRGDSGPAVSRKA